MSLSAVRNTVAGQMNGGEPGACLAARRGGAAMEFGEYFRVGDRWIAKLCVLAFALVGVGLAVTPAKADTIYIQPNVPDFYQHQKSGPLVNVPGENLNFTNPVPQPPANEIPSYSMTPDWWENGGGWCCITAYVNSFYYLEQQFGFTGLFTRPDGAGHTWQEQMV